MENSAYPDGWSSLVEAVLYMIQYEPSLDHFTARSIALMLVDSPLWTHTVREEYEIITDGLAARTPIPTGITTSRSDTVVRDFLGEVVSSMDDLRPWPEPPFTLLMEDRISDFVSTAPLARSVLSVSELEDRTGYLFSYVEGYGEFLLISSRSMGEVGFLNPLRVERENPDIVFLHPAEPIESILTELAQAMGLEREVFTVLR